MTMLTPNDPGTGRLFFWSRQGISVTELYALIQDAVTALGGGGGSGGGDGGGVTPSAPGDAFVEDPAHPGLWILIPGGGSSGVGTGTGGPTTALGITDSTDVGRAVITAPGATFTDRQAASRAALGAGTSSMVIGTTTGTAADGGILAGMVAAGVVVPPSGTTGLAVFAAATPAVAKTALALDQVDNTPDINKPISNAQSFAISQAILTASQGFVLDSERNIPSGVAGLDGSAKIPVSILPSSVALTNRQDASTGLWPARPVWPGPVLWIGTSVAPGGGTVTSATGMVADLDLELLGQ